VAAGQVTWSGAELVFLRETYPDFGSEYCADQLGRTVCSVRSKVKKLGLNLSAAGLSKLNTERAVVYKVAAAKRRSAPVKVDGRKTATREQQEARYAKARRTNVAKGRKLIAAGVDYNSVGGAMRMAIIDARAQMESEHRYTDPLEVAKTKLRRFYKPVVSMAYTAKGGPSDLYMVGNRANLTEQDLLALAEQAA
jgi:hypothetical protein